MDRRLYWSNYNLKRREEHRQILISFLGGRCIKCGSTDRLEFDHVDPLTKLFSIGANLASSIDKLMIEIKKCQLLCHDCHEDRHNKKEVEHGNGVAGKHHCKCILCRTKRTEYDRNRHA